VDISDYEKMEEESLNHSDSILYRCKDGHLFTGKMLKEGKSCGHQFGYASYVNPFEYIKWKFILWRSNVRKNDGIGEG
jgi:hypothetical protein